ncbi:MAG TPA: DUF167 domain-containing protein [Burkholderiales bacterium]|nr:DUF167 domain-containing protein [Burkholderiales bacterium]
MHGERLKVRVKGRAVDGEANEALVEFLAAHYRVPRRSVRILAGLRSRRKRVLIEESGSPPDTDRRPPAPRR